MGKQKERNFLSQKEKLAWDIFVNLELDLEFSVREKREKREF